MKIYNYVPKHFGYGIKRVASKLEQYKPASVKFVNNRKDADVVFIHTIGGQEVASICDSERFVLIQYCYVTTGLDKYYWRSVWEKAHGVVSYYDLSKDVPSGTRFVHTPLGADSKEFFNEDVPRDKKVFATGHVANTENLDVLWQACYDTKTTMYHTGEDFRFGKYYQYLPYMSQDKLRRVLNGVQYTSCMRTIEGFEMLGVEGLFCGARPIILDIPCYDWYRDYGYTVREGNLYEDLVALLSTNPDPVTTVEYSEVRYLFEWEDIVEKIYAELGI